MMPSKKHLPCLLFLLLFFYNLCGQQSEHYAFTHYRLADGLASNIVSNVVQDGEGFIWLATVNGLQRFDGNRFTTFKSGAGLPYGLPSDDVSAVYRDRKGRLWVLTADNKVGIFDTHTHRYRQVPLHRWQAAHVYMPKTFVETLNGDLLLLVNRTPHLFRLNADGKAFVPYNGIPFPNRLGVNHLVEDKHTRKVYMSTDSGFAVYNPATQRLSVPGNNADREPLLTQYASARYLNYLNIDSSRRLFFEQWEPDKIHPLLRVYHLGTGITKAYSLNKEQGLGYHQIKAVLQQRNGRIWVYGLPFVAEYKDAADPLQFLKKDYNKEGELKFNQVYSLYEDRQRNIWLCTDYGVYLFNPDAQLFHNYTLSTPERFAVEGRAQTALELPGGELWLGYRDLGLHRYDAQLRPLPLPTAVVPHQERKSVWDLHLHRKTGKIWMGLQGGRLIIYDTANQKAQVLQPPAFENRAVTQITEDHSGNLWLGTQGGNVIKWSYKPGAVSPADFTLFARTGSISKLYTDSRGSIWVAAAGAGLLQIDPARQQVLRRISEDAPKGYKLWDNNPRDILQYNDTVLLVATGAINFINLNTGMVAHLDNKMGLPSNTVFSMVRDAAGLLWLGTLDGMCMANPEKGSYVLYNQSDGLFNENFNSAGAHVLQDGRLLFTSAESFVLFDPAAVRTQEPPARPLLTDFRLMNMPLSVDSLLARKEVHLPYNRTFVQLEFSALNYNRLNKLDYFYKLENFDSSWMQTDNRHQAVYTYLPPGHYRFLLRTRNLAGVYSADSVSLDIVVHPPFWRTWWFYLLLLALVSVVLGLLYRERIKRLVTLHNVRSDIASHLHHEVSATLSNINVLSQIAKLKADKDLDRSKELIDEISGKSHNMILSMDEILWSIDPDNDSMQKTVLRLYEFAGTLKANCGTEIDIVVHEKVKELKLDMKVRHDFFIICKEALQVLAQCSTEKSVMVDIDLARGRMVLKILSTGTDASAPQLAELRRVLQDKAADLQAVLNFEMSKRDTSIMLSIPVR